MFNTTDPVLDELLLAAVTAEQQFFVEELPLIAMVPITILATLCRTFFGYEIVDDYHELLELTREAFSVNHAPSAVAFLASCICIYDRQQQWPSSGAYFQRGVVEGLLAVPWIAGEFDRVFPDIMRERRRQEKKRVR